MLSALGVLASVTAATAVESGQSVLAACIVASVPDIAAAVARFVAVEVVELLRSMFRQRTMVALTRVKAVVDMAVEAVRAVEPGAGSKKHPADKPVRSVVAIRRAVIGCVVKVAVGANRSHSDADGNLRRPQGGTTEQRNGEN